MNTKMRKRIVASATALAVGASSSIVVVPSASADILTDGMKLITSIAGGGSGGLGGLLTGGGLGGGTAAAPAAAATAGTNNGTNNAATADTTAGTNNGTNNAATADTTAGTNNGTNNAATADTTAGAKESSPKVTSTAPEAASAGEQDQVIGEFPVPTYKKSESKSSVSVKGTKSFDKDLELKPEGTGSVDVTINVNGKVPEGTKIGIYNGNKKLGESIVEDGQVVVSAKDLPKDANTFQLKASNGVKLSGMTCTADKGIDIPESEYATEDAIADFEKKYEAAKKKYDQDVSKANFGSNGTNGQGGKTITTIIPGSTTVKTITKSGGDSTTKVDMSKVTKGLNKLTPTDGTAGTDDTFLKKVLPILLGVGLPALGIGAAAQDPNVQAFFKNIQTGNFKIPGLEGLNLEGMFKGAIDAFNQGGAQLKNFQDNVNKAIQDGMGRFGIQIPNLENIRKQAEAFIQNAQKAAADAAGNLNINIPGLPQINLGPIAGQLQGLLKDHGNEILGVLGALLLLAIAVPLIVNAVKKGKAATGTDGTTNNDKNNSGEPTTNASGKSNITRDLTTITAPPKTTTTVIPDGATGGNGNVPKPQVPEPPQFVEKTLGQRDVPVRPATNGGVEFDIETGSILDCSVKASGGNTGDKDKDKDTSGKDKNNGKTTPSNNNKGNGNNGNNNPNNNPNNNRQQQAPALVAPQRVATPVADGPKVNTGGHGTSFLSRLVQIFA